MSSPPVQQQEEPRMASSSDLEQQIAAALRSVTPVATADAGAGGVAPDRAAAAAAIQRRKAAQRAARATDALSPALASARSLADQNLRRREQLRGLKDQLRDLQPLLREALEVKLRKESKCSLATESISESTATNDRLRTSVADLRDKRGGLAAIISDELRELPESNEGADMEKVAQALLWYEKFLGFRLLRVEGGFNFVFDKIDPQCPEKEFSFRVSPALKFIKSDPDIKDIDKLAKDLHLNENLSKFVRVAREKFQSCAMKDVSAAPLPSPMVMPVNNRSEDTRNQTQSLSKNSVLPAKREATALAGASPGVFRRSPRLEGMR